MNGNAQELLLWDSDQLNVTLKNAFGEKTILVSAEIAHLVLINMPTYHYYKLIFIQYLDWNSYNTRMQYSLKFDIENHSRPAIR